jgi:thiamine-phosphate pyrophosphorylase
LVTDEGLSKDRPLSFIVEEAIRAGVGIIQYREKSFSYKKHFTQAKSLCSICKKAKIPFIINDRVDLALALDADGVHLGQSDMPIQVARNLLGKDKMIGLSIESWKDWDTISTLPDIDKLIQYLGISPIFSTPTKQDTIGEWGIEGVVKLREKTDLPLVGIGGINESNIDAIIEAGIDSIAVVSAICSAESPYKSAKSLVSRF